MVNVQTLKGFRDFLPSEVKKREYVLNILKKMFESYGFEPLETPSLEYEEILTGKYGDEGDKLMYKFKDNGDRNVALRYDQTVPLARVITQYQNDLPMPFKRYQIQNVWRAENTQKGRYREFLQVDADIVGSNSSLSDTEIITVTVKSLEKLGFKDYKILINDRDTFKNLSKETVIAIDKWTKIGREGVLKEIVEKGKEKDWKKIDQLLTEIENQKPNEKIQDIFKLLESQKISSKNLQYSPSLARGLNYYTGIIFEIEINGYDAGSVAGGGRYDNLIGMFAGRDIPAVGFAFGFDRLIEAMDELQLFPNNLISTKVLVTNTNQDKALEITKRLRDEEIATEIYLEEKDLEKQLKYADKKQIPFVIILEESNLILKDMQKRTQEILSIDEIIKKLK